MNTTQKIILSLTILTIFCIIIGIILFYFYFNFKKTSTEPSTNDTNENTCFIHNDMNTCESDYDNDCRWSVSNGRCYSVRCQHNQEKNQCLLSPFCAWSSETNTCDYV